MTSFRTRPSVRRPQTVGARRVQWVEDRIRDTGDVPDGPCTSVWYAPGRPSWGCYDHGLAPAVGPWFGRCPVGRIADWYRRRHETGSAA